LMEWTPDRRYLNRVLQTIKTMLVSLVDNEKMVVIINSNHFRELSSLSMFERLTASYDTSKEHFLAKLSDSIRGGANLADCT